LSKGLRIASVVVGLAALVLLVRMAVFMVDVTRTEYSIQPGDKFRVQHSCLTAYAEGARFATEPDRNIYDAKQYKGRQMNGLTVDALQYPPPFVLLPGLLLWAGGDFLGMRPLWFAMQVAVLLGMVFAFIRFLGEGERKRLVLASPLFFIAPPTLFTLQMGNFQLSAFSLAMIGMIALSSTRPLPQAAGGLALAFATLSKIYPAVLGVGLLFEKRWRAVLWTAGAGVVLCALTMVVYGTGPFSDFIHYQIPRLSAGDAFPQTELPWAITLNQSFYGWLVKLRALGIGALDRDVGYRLMSIYGIAVFVFAGALAWRRRNAAEDRALSLQMWLALLNLASFRSPFLAGAYGTIGTIWILTIALATATTVRGRIASSASFVVLCVTAAILGSPRESPSTAILMLSFLSHTLMLAVNGVILARAWRRS
jgi:hypothetical protein